jgi:DNA-binding CsgD family transcriptional regulator
MGGPPLLEGAKMASPRLNLRRLVPNVQSLFDEGRFAEAAAIYDNIDSNAADENAVIVRARIALRIDPPRAIAILNRLHPKKTSSAAAWKAMVLGEAHALIGDYLAADTHLDDALRIARSVASRDLIAAAAYRKARRFIMSAEPQQARNFLPLARDGVSVSAKLDALHLESFILSREGRFKEQAKVLVELLRVIDPNSNSFMEHRACATHTLAALCRELFLPDFISEIERQLGGVPWPPDLKVNRFQAIKALAWAKALRGDYFTAFRYLKQSVDVADGPWRTMVFCDRAYLAIAQGEPKWSRQELSDAEESAAHIDWSAHRGEESVALLLLAELFAPIDAPKASSYLAEFRGLSDSKSALLLLRKDPRLTAFVEYASGVVERSLGNRKLAIARFQSAMKTFESLSYSWRAGRCALRLFEMTRKPRFLTTARDRLNDYSSSWLADELRNAQKGGKATTGLPPMQQRVFGHLCQGLSNAEIAEILGRSENTVANHAKAVLKAFHVSSRSALVAEAARRGLLPT